MIKRLALAFLTLVVASCGSVSDLQPQAGKSLPQKPALAARPLTANELLDLPTQADPRRVDELNKKGDVREPDRFDLPPPDGEAVPPPLAEPTTEQEPQT
ncbi:MAG TPA: hypothetical protein VFT40_10905 [Sphingomicrobium sp.]|nr:hypothetical protein [Sphingomicrobium sp.]